MKAQKFIDNNVFSFIEREKFLSTQAENTKQSVFSCREYSKHINMLSHIRRDPTQKKNLNEHMKYLSQLQNNKLITSFRVSQSRLMEIEKSNQKLLERILSISQRKYEQPNFCSGHLMPLGTMTSNHPMSKSLSVDFKRKETSKIMHENSFLVERMIKKKPFLPLKKINSDFQEHEQHLNRIRKMDSTNNKMKVRGLEKLSREQLRRLPHLNEISRCVTHRMQVDGNPPDQRSKSCNNLRQRSTPQKKSPPCQANRKIEPTHFSNEFLDEKPDSQACLQ